MKTTANTEPQKFTLLHLKAAVYMGHKCTINGKKQTWQSLLKLMVELGETFTMNGMPVFGEGDGRNIHYKCTALVFLWNGIKHSAGKLQTVFYSEGPFNSYPAGTIAIYKKEYEHFTQEVRDAFIVRNDTDTQTDYFDTDKFYVTPTHKLYAQVCEALALNKERNRKRAEKRALKFNLLRKK